MRRVVSDLLILGGLLGCASAASLPRAPGADPQRAVEELLATDRAFASAAANTTIIPALVAMFTPDISMQAPGGHAVGIPAVTTALSASAANATNRGRWAPIRGGVSSDGRQGFTFGYFTIARADGTELPAKYLSYWIRTPDGWRVAAYKRVPRVAGDVSLELLSPALPAPGLPIGDSAQVRRYANDLRATEIAFSDEAAQIGIGPAFVKFGASDAVNTGGPATREFVRGNEAIAASVSAGGPTPVVSWAPSRVIVSATGDLGVTIGSIKVRAPAPPAGEVRIQEVPFFTIWRRATPRDPWRYVAE
jgi:hypothetical protein